MTVSHDPGTADPTDWRRPPLTRAAAGLPDPAGWQRAAISSAVAALHAGGRGQIHAACGTGKTIAAAHVATTLCPPGGLVVVACPSVTLVSQTLAVLAPVASTVLTVCSDDSVADAAVHTADLPATVTTEPSAIAGWLRSGGNRGMRLVVTTHRSASLLGDVLTTAGVPAEVLVGRQPPGPRRHHHHLALTAHRTRHRQQHTRSTTTLDGAAGRSPAQPQRGRTETATQHGPAPPRSSRTYRPRSLLKTRAAPGVGTPRIGENQCTTRDTPSTSATAPTSVSSPSPATTSRHQLGTTPIPDDPP
ncbi:DEAD/DEAH box helicase family protein [Micromonospora sp. NPDC092111]|uniref:DEAD/DEAH box helicase family protein n=1 Tax=Micromonospora sp. NPDC092111 TaxID=3364289 RepID=UPI0037F3B668